MNRRHGAAVFVALVLACGTTTPASAATFDSGHIDVFNVTYEGNRLTLDLREDVTGFHVRQDPSNVTLTVKDKAATQITPQMAANVPPGLSGTIWFLPQTQDQSLIWPGLSTEGVPAASVTGPVQVEVGNVQGPGRVYLWNTGSFGGPQPALSGGGYTLPGTLTPNANVHVHYNWAFTAAGRYSLSVLARATVAGASVSSNPATYVFQVGSATSPPPPGQPGAPNPAGGGAPPPPPPAQGFAPQSGPGPAPMQPQAAPPPAAPPQQQSQQGSASRWFGPPVPPAPPWMPPPAHFAPPPQGPPPPPPAASVPRVAPPPLPAAPTPTSAPVTEPFPPSAALAPPASEAPTQAPSPLADRVRTSGLVAGEFGDPTGAASPIGLPVVLAALAGAGAGVAAVRYLGS